MKPVYQFHNGGPVRTYLRSGPPFLIIATYVVILVACGRTYVAEEIPNTFEMPAGVAITVDLVTPAQPEEIEVGESFTGTLAEPLYYPRQKVEPDGEVFEEETLVAPVGAPVAGRHEAARDAKARQVLAQHLAQRGPVERGARGGAHLLQLHHDLFALEQALPP